MTRGAVIRLAAGVFALATGPSALAASGVACDRAVTAVETRICATPKLHDLDARLAQTFGTWERSAPAGERKLVREEQQAWIARRDARCPTAEVACLAAEMQARLDILKLSNTPFRRPRGPVGLYGVWKVGELLDPQRAGEAASNVEDELYVHELPAPGETVKARDGGFCTPVICRLPRWVATSPGQALMDEQITPAPDLKPAAPAYEMMYGQKAMGTVLQMRDGRLLFPITLCDADDKNCRTGFEQWTPASPDARLGPG